MIKTYDIPSVDLGSFREKKAIGILTEKIGEIFDEQYPAIHLLASKRCKSPVNNKRDIPSVIEALANLGYSACYETTDPSLKERRKGFRATAALDIGWHLDGSSPPYNFQRVYSELPSHLLQVSLRRHQAIESTAHVAMRQTVYGAFKSKDGPTITGFRAIKGGPTFETVQNPGDRIIFVALGGVVDGRIIPPAEHCFKTVTEDHRTVVAGRFDFTSKAL